MLDVDNTLPLSQRELADASESNIMGRPVEAGEEISFRVTLKAPSREGTFISYWRLKTAKGLPFGHRLWCHIEVVSPIAPSAPPSETRPAMPAQMPTVVSNKAYPEVVGVMTSAPSTSSVPSDPPETMSGKDRADSNSKTISQQTLVQEEPSSKATSDKDGQTSTADVNPHPPSASDATDTQLQEELQRVAKLRQALIQRMHWQRCLDLSRRISADLGGVDQPPKQETAESPVPEKSVETQTESSGMIFPQLEKESPESSTHEAVSQQPESAAGTVSSEQSDAEFFEDAESVDIRSVSSDGDEGFMTDEEYDILNASDEETA
jgi:next-to-BRCA1 protein 1